MQILIITDSFPFPPRNGKELPIAKIFSILSAKIKIDLLIISPVSNDTKVINLSNNSIATTIYTITGKRVRTLSGKKLYKGYRFDEMEVAQFVKNKNYDWLWISPYPCYSFVDFCRINNFIFYKQVALGLNDELSYSYKNRFIKTIFQKSFTIKSFGWLIQSEFLKREQRKIFDKIDLIHVQTEKEKERLLKVIGHSNKNRNKIVAASNGINKTLLECTYLGIDSNYILCMTQLSSGRRDEGKWFFKIVWPKVKKMLPDAKVLIVGSPPQGKIPSWLEDDSIKILGFVDNLKNIYEQVSVSVVPTYHSSGLINRVQDALVAGVPVITTKRAMETFPGVKINREVLASDNPSEIAKLLISLHMDKKRKKSLSRTGKKIANGFETWESTANKIYKKLIEKDEK